MATYDFTALVADAAAKIVSARRIPRATYRLQFNKGFTFSDAEALVPYLDALGISEVYASPILKASPGSMHGYDICDPRELNPELGTPEDFARLCDALKARDMGLIMDIVPNHMGISDPCNVWWMDVLENGMSSPYAHYFDIDWNPVKPELRGKVLLPILEDQYGNVLESGKLALIYDGGAFFLTYADHVLPVAPETYSMILDLPVSYLVMQLGEASEQVLELQSILTALKYLPEQTTDDPERQTERERETAIIKRRIGALYDDNDEVRRALDDVLARFNATDYSDDPQNYDHLHALIDVQNYRLAFWRVAAEEINYRRFFDINTMAAIRVELPEVFEATHAFIFELLATGKVTALRIDHPDGLWNPPEYFRKLQEQYVAHAITAELDGELSANERSELERAVTDWFDAQYRADGKFTWGLYVVAEKILSETEPLPLDWAVYGTTGYDFMNLVNSLFVDNALEDQLSAIFTNFTGRAATFSQLEYNSKRLTMQNALASEINALARRLERLSEANRHTRDFTLNGLLYALREVIACLSIYRTYTDGVDSVSPRDAQFVEAAVHDAKQRNPRVASTVFDFIRDTLLLRNLDQFPDHQRDLIDFTMRFQQITGPVMAKSVEDTLFYVYNRLVSVNEVGGSPAVFGITPQEFADENMKRCRLWSAAMLATSTHDTKRSEDVRARLNVLSELPAAWGEALQTWSRINAEHKVMLDSGPAPSANDEYLLYQTLLGTYPFEMEDAETYCERIVDYMSKATKEAKVVTSWTNVNQAYDEAVAAFVRAILTSASFLEAFAPLQKQIAFFGKFNGLAQTLLKLTCPGIPDTYRGTEVWDFSLVDPDNRRPVDYDHLQALLTKIESHSGERAELAVELLAQPDDGCIKLYTIKRALDLRCDYADLFIDAPYQPIAVVGAHEDRVCAFMRVYDHVGVLVVVPRLIAGLTQGALQAPIGAVWGDTRLMFDGIAGETLHNLFTDEMLTCDGEVALAALLKRFPVGLFTFDAT